MRMVDLIEKKRDGEVLSKQELDFIITKPYENMSKRNKTDLNLMAKISGVSLYSWKSYISKGCLANVETIDKIGQTFGSSCNEFFKYAEIHMEKKSSNKWLTYT